VLKGALARLERALGQWMLDAAHRGARLHRGDRAATWSTTPTIYGTGQLPKFGEDLFRTTDGRWLIPTAEVPLTNFAAARSSPRPLPIRLTALTPCFRSEAGAPGATRAACCASTSSQGRTGLHHHARAVAAEHERMTRCAERVLTELGLTWRRVLLCAGDTGFGAAKTYDLEVWLPGQQAWREISSCSNCRDFQARRMKARFRPKAARERSSCTR
jgi:seryl-tRNA synthetase